MQARGSYAVAEPGIARLILQYLYRHPHAKDTREAIVSWWLQQQQIEQAVEVVSRALDFLVIRDFIVEQRGPDLRAYYKINERRLAEIARFLEESPA